VNLIAVRPKSDSRGLYTEATPSRAAVTRRRAASSQFRFDRCRAPNYDGRRERQHAGPGGIGSGPYLTLDKFKHWRWVLSIIMIGGVFLYRLFHDDRRADALVSITGHPPAQVTSGESGIVKSA
jgi:hypothetical protein